MVQYRNTKSFTKHYINPESRRDVTKALFVRLSARSGCCTQF